MPDITMCSGGDCPLKDKCYRYLAKPDSWQSYFAEPPFEGNECEHKWAVDNAYHIVYDGYGQVTYTDTTLRYKPMTSTREDETHACLILLKETMGKDYVDFKLKFTGKVVRQLRLNTPPNPWETMWVVFDYLEDSEQGNYFVHKTNGVEMGQFIGMEQDYFVTNGKSPCNIGQFYNYEVIKKGDVFTFKINTKIVAKYPTSITDKKPLNNLNSGIGFYCEDAEILIKNVSFTGVEI